MRLSPRRMLTLLPLVVVGCQTGGSTITAKPDNWADYAGRTVTVEGTAGNTAQGAIVRLADGGYIPLAMREKWGIDAVTRPVSVTGEIISGQGIRGEDFVLKVSNFVVVPPDRSGQSGSSGGL